MRPSRSGLNPICPESSGTTPRSRPGLSPSLRSRSVRFAARLPVGWDVHRETATARVLGRRVCRDPGGTRRAGGCGRRGVREARRVRVRAGALSLLVGVDVVQGEEADRRGPLGVEADEQPLRRGLGLIKCAVRAAGRLPAPIGHRRRCRRSERPIWKLRDRGWSE